MGICYVDDKHAHSPALTPAISMLSVYTVMGSYFICAVCQASN